MNGKVVLSVKGMPDRQYLFTQPMVCTVGRGDDCDVQVPRSEWYAWISRHHCQIDVDPPRVVVRDLGSLNGTFVNGRMIGMRDASLFGRVLPRDDVRAHELHDGDEIGIGDIVLQVSIEEVEPEYTEEIHDEAGELVAH